MGVKMNFRIITKNHAADPEIGFLTKSISKPNGRATAMPTAWELNAFYNFTQCKFQFILNSNKKAYSCKDRSYYLL